MAPFEGLTLEQWEKMELLKHASKMMWLAEETRKILIDFANALWLLSGTAPAHPYPTLDNHHWKQIGYGLC